MIRPIKLNWTKSYLCATIPFIGFYIGVLLDRHEDERLSMFRDKSELYKREMKPGEPPSWP